MPEKLSEIEQLRKRVAELEKRWKDSCDAGEALAVTNDQLADDATRWHILLDHLGGSTIRKEDGNTYFCVVLQTAVGDPNWQYRTTKQQFIEAIEAAGKK